MGCSNSKEDTKHPSHRSEEEKQAALKRQAIASAAIRKALGLAADAKVPTVGIALSGGGWRSMTGSVAFLDCLAEAELLDTVTYAAGVSGGAWVLYEWMLMAANHNAFHKPGVRNAWFHSSTPAPVDPHAATYDGLMRMRNIQHVRHAAKFDDKVFDGVSSAVFQEVGGKHLLIPAVLVSKQLGDSPIERWGAFLKEDLLGWLPADHNGAIPNTGHVADGTSPILLSALVASTKDGHFDWMESSPFGLRRLPPHGIDTVPNSRLSLKYENGHAVDSPKIWHTMAAAGAWFGIDEHAFVSDNAPRFDDALHAVGINLSTKPIVDGVSSKFFETGKESAVTFGETRDAGIQENIAYPLLFSQTSDREVDLILALENSRAIKPSAKSIEDAVRLGLIPEGVYDVSTASKPLGESEGFLRVFKPKVKGYPVVVILLGLQEESTLKLTATEEEVRDQVHTVRDRFTKHFAGAIKREMTALAKTYA